MAFTPRTTKPGAGNKYYIRKASGGYNGAIKGSPTDPECDVLANCVGYAVGRFNEIGGWGSCKYLSPVNAENFLSYKGDLEVGQEPRLGACAVWQAGATLNGSDGAGHVAIVEKIISSTEIVTSESGWGCANPFWTQTRKKGSDGNWGQGSNYKFLGFIYNPAVQNTSGDTYTVGKDNEETTFNFCIEVLGFNVAAAVGVITNVKRESDFETGAIGDGGTSYGICQWHNTRNTNLRNWCSNNGKDYAVLDGQLWYMKYELETSYKAVLTALKAVPNTAQGAYDAAYTWCKKFEIPADTENTSKSRGELAKNTYWPKYSGSAASGSSATPSASVDSFKVGDIVTFTGTTHYANANATSGPACKAGVAKVTQLYPTGKHPVHLIAESGGGSTVYGWVDVTDITSTSSPASKPEASTTTSVKEKRATEAAMSLDKSLSGAYTVTAASGLHLRNGAGTNKASLVVLPNRTKVQNYGYYTESGGVKWLYVQVTYGGVKYTGFCSAQYLSK